MESQPQNPEFRNNPENFHPCVMSATYIQMQSRQPLIMKANTMNPDQTAPREQSDLGS